MLVVSIGLSMSAQLFEKLPLQNFDSGFGSIARHVYCPYCTGFLFKV